MQTIKRRGGEWVLTSPAAAEVFTPEDMDDLQKQVVATMRDFVQREVAPALPAMEAHDFSHNVRLLKRAAALGLLGLEVPEEYGGLNVDKMTAMAALEELAGAGGWSVTYGVQTGIGLQPILFFGNRAQKQKYLPRLVSAEIVGAYCLTEASAGSDAQGIQTTARLSPDGQCYLLNGTKQWISNGGFADLFVVYAKVDGEKITAFIVERGFPGVSTGREEEKMGIRSSSTTTVILQDARVPVHNVLYEVGKGFQIATNTLNIGRYKLGAGAVGSGKLLLSIAARYAAERRAFGKAIAEFPLIQQKLAEMAVRTYAVESASYRTAAQLDAALGGIDLGSEDGARQAPGAIREYSVECAIMKVIGSELMAYAVDEAVQIHGGYGFMEEYPVARAYRDARIYRIFEGTNEINRLLTTGELLKKAMRGALPLLPALMNLQSELLSLTPPLVDPTVPLAQEQWLLTAARKVILMVAGLGVQKYGVSIEAEQEFLAGVADMLMDLFQMESGLLRAEKHPSEARRDLAVAFSHDAFGRIEATARNLLASLDEGDSLRTQLSMLRKLTRRDPVNNIALKRRIAQRVLAAGGYTA